ncbi:hypothetical protein Tco_0778831, partial [Tanacetum coccineum]
GSMEALWVINRQFQKFIDSQFSLDYGSQMTDKYFVEYTRIEYDRRVNKRHMQMQESKIDTGKALDVDLVVTESSGIESEVQDESSRSGNDTNTNDADIRPIYDEEPMVKIQEKVFAITALKNELRKSKGNSVDTKFSKPSVLGKQILQPLRNQSVVRQLTRFKLERPKISKLWFASQVDVKNNLSKLVTQHYLPKGREYAFAKPNHVIASSESRNSSKNMPSFRSNDMVHNHYLEGAKKKTQQKDRNSKSSMMHTASPQNTTNGSKPKPRSNNQTSRSLHVSKSSCVTSNVVPLVDHFRNSSPFLDSEHFTQSHKTRNSNKPVNQKSHTQKPSRQISTRHRFSPNKTSVVYKKTSPRSCLRWKPTGRIFKSVGLRWIPIGKLFDSCTHKADSDSTHGSSVDISKIRECKQTLDLSAEADISETNVEVDSKLIRKMAPDHVSSDTVPQCSTTALKQDNLSPIPQSQENVPHAAEIVTTSNELDFLFSLMFDELLNGTTPVVSKSSAVHAANAPDQRQQQNITPSTSTTVAADTPPLNIQTTPETTSQAPTVTATESIYQAKTHQENAQGNKDKFINIFSTPVHEQGETSSRYVDSSNMHTFYQRHPSEHRWTRDHPLEQVIENPSQSIRIGCQLETNGEMCMFALTVS